MLSQSEGASSSQIRFFYLRIIQQTFCHILKDKLSGLNDIPPFCNTQRLIGILLHEHNRCT